MPDGTLTASTDVSEFLKQPSKAGMRAAMDAPSNSDIAAQMAAQEAYTLAHINARALAPMLHFDGSGGLAVTALGATGSISGTGDFTLEGYVEVPPAAVGAHIASLTSSTSEPRQPGSVHLFFGSSDNLTWRLYGATSSDYADLRYLGIFAAHAGRSIHIAAGRRLGVPFLLINGQVVTTEAPSGGAAPDWSTTALAGTLLTQGRLTSSVPSVGRISPFRPYNYAKTTAEIASLIRVGPTATDFLGQTLRYVSDFSGGADGWESGSSALVTGNVDGIAGEDDWLAVAANGGSSNWFRRPLPGVVSGALYRVRGKVYVGAGYLADYIGISIGISTMDATTASTLTLVKGAIMEFDLTFFARGIVERISVGPVNTASGGTTLASVAGTDVVYLKNVQIERIGLITNQQITRSAILRDAGPNRLHGWLSAGVTPQGGTMEPITGKLSESGYVGGDNPLIFDPHFVESVWVRPTTATIPTVTFRRDSSTGPIVCAATSAGVQDEWIQLPLSAATRSTTQSRSKYYFPLSPAAEIEYQINPRAL